MNAKDQKLLAIKHYKEATGERLLESKNYIEEVALEMVKKGKMEKKPWMDYVKK